MSEQSYNLALNVLIVLNSSLKIYRLENTTTKHRTEQLGVSLSPPYNNDNNINDMIHQYTTRNY